MVSNVLMIMQVIRQYLQYQFECHYQRNLIVWYSMVSNAAMNMQVIRLYLQVRMPLPAQPHLLVFHGFKGNNEHAID